MFTSIESFKNIADPSTDLRLLPTGLWNKDNTEELSFCKTALRYLLVHELTAEQADLLHRTYWKEETNQEIARAYGLSPSGVSRRLGRLEEQMEQQIQFALHVYREHKSKEGMAWEPLKSSSGSGSLFSS